MLDFEQAEAMPQDKENESREAIGRRLEALRMALGNDSQEAFADRCGGQKRTAWNNYELGRRRIELSNALKVRAATGVPTDWIYAGDEQGLPKRVVDGMRKLGLDLSTGRPLDERDNRKRGRPAS